MNNLNTLDRKFGTLLQFQGLLGIATSIFIGTLRNMIVADPAMILLLSVFSAIWFVITFFALRGVGRIRWGDLWTREDILLAEHEYVETLIHTVIRRTAAFRLAVLLAFLNGIVLVSIVAAIGLRVLS